MTWPFTVRAVSTVATVAVVAVVTAVAVVSAAIAAAGVVGVRTWWILERVCSSRFFQRLKQVNPFLGLILQFAEAV